MTEPYWSGGTVTLHLGDCLDVLAAMDPASVDAVVTDPPYGLEFMGKDWDTFSADPVSRAWDSRGRAKTAAPQRDPRTPGGRSAAVTRIADNPRCRTCGRAINGQDTAKGFKVCHCEQPDIYAPSTSVRKYQAWCEQWAAECLRVLKPGGHLLAFGGTRTWHRLACGIEDAGFEIRDSLADLTGREGPGLLWVYGSGFPKSLDVSKAIDKAAGAEREVIGAKRSGLAMNDQLNDDNWHNAGTGEGGKLVAVTAPATEDAVRWSGWGTALKPAWEPIVVARKPLAGTVAGNVTEHGTGALNVDGCRVPGDEDGSRNRPPSRLGSAATYAQDEWTRNAVVTRQDTTGQGRWPPNVLLGPEAAAELDRQSGVTTSSGGTQGGRLGANGILGEFAHNGPRANAGGLADTGGASRFFPVFRYEAKAPGSERPRGDDGTAHPTVKPVDLMAWLVRLVTPPGGLVADPFAGSGTTAEACIVEGFRCVLIEKDPAYAALIRKRLRKDIQPAMFGS